MPRGAKPAIGNYRQLAVPDAAFPPCPDWLCPEARAEWQRVLPPLVESGFITHLDHAMCAQYFETAAMHRAMLVELRVQGTTYKTDKGEPRVNPLSRECKSLGLEVRRMASELGFTPAGRSKIDAPPTKPQMSNTIASFLAQQAREEADEQPH